MVCVEDFISQFVKRLPSQTQTCLWAREAIANDRKLWERQAEAQFPGIALILQALQGVMPKGGMIYSDMTQFSYLVKEIWNMPCLGHWHHPSGFGTLGYALPTAIGEVLRGLACQKLLLEMIMAFNIRCLSLESP